MNWYQTPPWDNNEPEEPEPEGYKPPNQVNAPFACPFNSRTCASFNRGICTAVNEPCNGRR